MIPLVVLIIPGLLRILQRHASDPRSGRCFHGPRVARGAHHDRSPAPYDVGPRVLRLSSNRPRLAQADGAKDWPTYNHDVLGSRYNRGETAIGPDNAGRLEEKWRFPAMGSGQEIGAIHATPVVVDGYVYFGTTSATPTFYKAGRPTARSAGPAAIRSSGGGRLNLGGAGGQGDPVRAPPAGF